VEVHHGNQPPSPQKRLGLASADPTWPPYQATRVGFSIYDFAITLYDALVFENPATSNAQLKLSQQRVMSIAVEHVRLKLAADIESERMLLPIGSLRKRYFLPFAIVRGEVAQHREVTS
jgi:hypothetical protein